ncbi:MAG: hypothetical protein KF799_07845 [Bdellovibrionales bacterium]|nr:hypothetical protein [Bdellovibrionales bacterium]
MFNLTMNSTTKIGALVTSIVLLGACSAKQVKQDAQAFQTPEPIVESSYNYQEPAQFEKSSHFKAKNKKKKRTKYAKKAGKSTRQHIAKRVKAKETLAVAQVGNDINMGGGSGMGSIAPSPVVSAPVIPPPPFMESAQVDSSLWARTAGNWRFWLVLVSALSLMALAFKIRRGNKNSRHRLVFNR